MPRGQIARPVRCIESNEVFESAKAAGKSVGLASIAYALSPSAKSNKAGGKSWEYFDGDGASPAGRGIFAPAPADRKAGKAVRKKKPSAALVAADVAVELAAAGAQAQRTVMSTARDKLVARICEARVRLDALEEALSVLDGV